MSRPDDSDRARLERIGCRFVGLGLLAFALVMLPVATSTSGLTEPWWTPTSVVLVVGPAAALVAVTFRPEPGRLVPLVYAGALGYLVATLLWFVAWRGVPDETARYTVWLVQFPSLASIALVLVSRTRWALVNLVTATLLAHMANEVGLYGEVRPVPLLSAPLTMALSGVFIAVAYATTRTVRSLDDRRAATLRAAASSAADMAQESERARFAGMIHDNVIATLLAVEEGRPDPRLVRTAASALDELDRGEDPDASAVGVCVFAERIRAAAAAVGGRVRVDLWVPDREIFYPAEAVAAVIGSTAEALRNWSRHAGAVAGCVVTAEFADDTVRVTIADDGSGFDPESVGKERYGIAVGIHGRMDVLAGGSAEVHSQPGRGTRVTVGWRRP